MLLLELRDPAGHGRSFNSPVTEKGRLQGKELFRNYSHGAPFSHKPQGPLLMVQFLAQPGSAYGRTPRQARGAAPKAGPSSLRPFTSRFLQNLRQLAPDPHLNRSGPPAPLPKPEQFNIPLTNAKNKLETGPLGLEARCRSPPGA